MSYPRSYWESLTPPVRADKIKGTNVAWDRIVTGVMTGFRDNRSTQEKFDYAAKLIAELEELVVDGICG